MAKPESRGAALANRVFGIDVNERYATLPSDLDTRAIHTVHPADIYFEHEPTVAEFFKELAPSRAGAISYARSLFPSAQWIPRYNLRWLTGDIVAGITIGLVVVPQAMAYAALAQLPPAYGLYTSFTGVVSYFIFGTSKDIVIGATAVGSLLVGEVIHHVNSLYPNEYTNPEIAHCLSMLSGAVLLIFGLLRLGWIIEFIPYIPISAFVTSASITIMSTQIPTALGIPGINSREPPYKVIINTLKGLPNTQLDAAIGLSCIALLFAIQITCNKMEVRQPLKKKTWSFLSSLRMTFVMLLYILISYLVHRADSTNRRFQIVGTIEPGFQAANVPRPDMRLMTTVLPQLPAVVIILIIEHIAIAKAMGRMFNYTVIPSQEIVAGGIANLFSPFVGGYVCTGSFGASAVLSKAGARTPLAGVFSAFILILALYALTAVFFYIPKAALAGLIIHAVSNLIAPPKNLYKYWQLSPLELLIWIICVVLAMFESLEIAIYVGVGLSLAVMLVRLARTPGRFMGEVRTKRAVDDAYDSDTLDSETRDADGERSVFVPLDRKDASNPGIAVKSPYPGVFIYRFSENYSYMNQACHVEQLMAYIMDHTTRTSEEEYERPSDRLWNDPGPKPTKLDDHLPHLRALVLDFSAVNNLDITSVQGLVDLRNTLDRYCSPDTCEWHFANVQNRWARRALASASFGFPTAKNARGLSSWVPSYTIASILPVEDCREVVDAPMRLDEERRIQSSTTLGSHSGNNVLCTSQKDDTDSRHGEASHMATLYGVDRPFFHIDLLEAVDSAVRTARNKDRRIPV
ncbi:sulfate transporter family-domain-containing protein [Stachybotrys elegans]|uniref:Sulfate transporter family-domain-containing protein n=1 Tax=Stachybotrys elegans TaxID=80388 RepID=A0A8K0SRB2_9HYPO|nr:sulfate transporter family-domain-containing protein [Stachybotrys elegans]